MPSLTVNTGTVDVSLSCPYLYRISNDLTIEYPESNIILTVSNINQISQVVQ